MRRRFLGVGLVVLMGLLGVGRAEAHAILVESTPAIGATIAAGTTRFRLRYNSRIDRARSRLTLIHADHSTSVIRIDDAGTDDLIFADVTVAAGRYTLRWQVLAVDGHITRGDVPFVVSAGN